MAEKIHLYAIRLDDAVLQKAKFKAKNPGYLSGKPCYYIGSSVHEPEIRFAQHKEGYRSSRIVRLHGLHVSKSKCKVIEVGNREARDRKEHAYATELRAKGYGIWQN